MLGQPREGAGPWLQLAVAGGRAIIQSGSGLCARTRCGARSPTWRPPPACVSTPKTLAVGRCFEIPLDESPEQTARIHERQKALRSLQRLTASDTRERIQERHHHAQRLLEPIPVVIPYVDKLTFPTQWLRSRRDHDRFLTLIEVIAYLHQHQRPRKVFQGVEYIEATVADYRWAYFLAHKVLRNSLDEVSRWAREMLTFFETENPVWPTRRELRERLQWPPRRVRDVVDELLELEYLEARTGPNNQHSFQLVPSSSGSPFVAGILHPDELESLWPGTAWLSGLSV